MKEKGEDGLVRGRRERFVVGSVEAIVPTKLLERLTGGTIVPEKSTPLCRWAVPTAGREDKLVTYSTKDLSIAPTLVIVSMT